MKSYYKTIDGMIYLNVNKKAERLWDSKTFDMYVIWEKGSTTYRLPLIDEAEFRYALNQKEKVICIEIGHTDELVHILKPTKISWDKADIISYDGFIYVKYNDLLE